MPASAATQLSIIIPTLNEEAHIAATLQPLQAMRQRGHEVLLVDGGSYDATVTIAAPFVDQIIHSEKGRAVQMNRGAAMAHGAVLWFIHADTLVPEGSDQVVLQRIGNKTNEWGRFDVRLSGQSPLLKLVAHLMNFRSCLTGIATGDQGIWLHRSLFHSVGGYPVQPLMEDIALSVRLKRFSRPYCISPPLITSSRRWENRGIWRTILLMWRLRLLYALGADPVALARLYR